MGILTLGLFYCSRREAIKLKYKIVPAHWSVKTNESHTQNDADATYLVEGDPGEELRVFSTYEEAVQFVKQNSKTATL